MHAEAVRLALAGVMAVAAIELRELRRIDALRAHRSQANDVGEIRRVLNWKPRSPTATASGRTVRIRAGRHRLGL